jgi:hypothetical protein
MNYQFYSQNAHKEGQQVASYVNVPKWCHNTVSKTLAHRFTLLFGDAIGKNKVDNG